MSLIGEIVAGSVAGTWVTGLGGSFTMWRDSRRRSNELRAHMDTRLNTQDTAIGAVAANLAILTPQYQATAATVDRHGGRIQSLAEITAVLEDRTARFDRWAQQRDRDTPPDPRRVREPRPPD